MWPSFPLSLPPPLAKPCSVFRTASRQGEEKKKSLVCAICCKFPGVTPGSRIDEAVTKSCVVRPHGKLNRDTRSFFFSPSHRAGFNYCRVFPQRRCIGSRPSVTWCFSFVERGDVGLRLPLCSLLLFLPVAFLWFACVSGLKRTKEMYAWWALNDDLMIAIRWQTSGGGVCGSGQSRCPWRRLDFSERALSSLTFKRHRFANTV